MIRIQEIVVFLLVTILNGYSVFLAIFIFLFPGGMASLRHSPSSSSETLHRRICQRSCHYFAFHQNGGLAQPKPLDKISQDYKQWFFLAFSPLQNIVIILLRPVLSKNKENEKHKKNKNNKGCQEIIGLILFGKNPKITATHRNVVVLCHRIEKNIKHIFFSF